YIIDTKELYKMIDNPDAFKEVKNKVIKLGRKKTLIEYFESTALKTLGYHIYYLTLTDNYHTLILFIDNSKPASPEFEIWDDDMGKTNAYGPMAGIMEGMRQQTSWTFAHSFKGMGHRKDHFSKHTTRLWKIQRK
ncbi:MAG: hypothetical protein M3Y54_13430, partial [Bacteroidota bacterium]|nr:hypothetical protein [Bacteroidota bacterium]